MSKTPNTNAQPTDPTRPVRYQATCETCPYRSPLEDNESDALAAGRQHETHAGDDTHRTRLELVRDDGGQR
jgi:hypothetical protein